MKTLGLLFTMLAVTACNKTMVHETCEINSESFETSIVENADITDEQVDTILEKLDKKGYSIEAGGAITIDSLKFDHKATMGFNSAGGLAILVPEASTAYIDVTCTGELSATDTVSGKKVSKSTGYKNRLDFHGTTEEVLDSHCKAKNTKMIKSLFSKMPSCKIK